MFNLIKPGHVLRFGTDPYTIASPQGSNVNNDNTLETAWPNTSNLGLVQCISHPDGAIGKIAAEVATKLRGPSSISRAASYSDIGRFVTASNRAVGSVNCDFVGYTDGKTNYIHTNAPAFSKDFSGCLFVLYSVNGQRRVAHAASSGRPDMDCKQAFLNTLQAQHAILHGWFRPFQLAVDGGPKAVEYGLISQYVANQINNLTTFGVITAAGVPYAINAFKPRTAGNYGGVMPGNDWIVTSVSQKAMSQSWIV
jgi:hypothetical protein